MRLKLRIQIIIIGVIMSVILGFSQRSFAGVGGAEYFIDNDPGVGLGSSIPAPDDGAYDSNEESVTVDVDTTNLSIGYHTVYVRFVSDDGLWGIARPLLNDIYTAPVPNIRVTGDLYIVDAEYFIDSDPGEGKGTSVPAKDGSFDEAEEDVELTGIAVSALTAGTHTAYLRMKDSNGKWGTVREYDFEVFEKTNIVSAEYYFDTDPGDGQGTPLELSSGSFGSRHVSFETNIPTSDLIEGEHTLCMKLFDSLGRADVTCLPVTVYIEDSDGDGFTIEDNDCDDSDPDINPGATEICSDGVDQNCDEVETTCTGNPTITPPVIDTRVVSGKPLSITSKITDNREVRSASIYYQPIGSNSFTEGVMLKNGNDWVFLIPKITAYGLNYYIVAQDSDGNTSTSLRTQVYESGGYGEESEGPTIIIEPILDSTVGQPLVIIAEITDNGVVSSASLHYQPIGSNSFTEEEMLNNGNNWVFTVPNLTRDGLNYYIVAKDDDGNTSKTTEEQVAGFVPTLNEWGLIVLVTMLSLVAFYKRKGILAIS